MTASSGGRPSKADIVIRREKVRELFLKGKNTHAIATELDIHYNTALSDINFLQARYSNLVAHNSHLAERQMARVEHLLDEILIVKNNYLELYKVIEERVSENKIKIKEWEDEVKTTKQELTKAEIDYRSNPCAENRRLVRDLRRKYDIINREPKYPTYVTTRIDTLKAIIDRLDKEAKLLNLFNPKDLIEKNYISVEVLKSVMEIFKGIILDLIPEDKRMYAFKRLKTIDIQSLNGKDVVEAEFKEERPKKVKIKEIEEDESEIDI